LGAAAAARPFSRVIRVMSRAAPGTDLAAVVSRPPRRAVERERGAAARPPLPSPAVPASRPLLRAPDGSGMASTPPGASPRPNYDGVARLVDELGDAAQELLQLNARWDAASGGAPVGPTPVAAPPRTRADVFEEASRLGIEVPDQILASLDADGFIDGGGGGEDTAARTMAARRPGASTETNDVSARSQGDAEWMQRFIEGVGLADDEAAAERKESPRGVGEKLGAVQSVSVAKSPRVSSSTKRDKEKKEKKERREKKERKEKEVKRSPRTRASANAPTFFPTPAAPADVGRMEELEASVRRQLERASALEQQLNARAWALDAREDALRGGEAEVEGRLAEVAASSRVARDEVLKAQKVAYQELQAREQEVERREKAIAARERGFAEKEKAAQGVVKAQSNVLSKVGAMKRELLEVANRERAMRSEFRKEKRHLEETLELAQQACSAKDDEIRTLKTTLNRQRRTAKSAVAEETERAVAGLQKQLDEAEDKAKEKLRMTERALRAESSKALVALKAKLQEQWEGEIAAREKEVRNLTRARDAAETKRRSAVSSLEEALSAAKFEVQAVKRGAAEEAKVAEAKCLRLQQELHEARKEAEGRIADARRQAGWNVSKARQSFERELQASFAAPHSGSYPPSTSSRGEREHVARGLEESERARQAERANFLDALSTERERAIKAEELARQLAGVLEATKGGSIGPYDAPGSSAAHHRAPSPEYARASPLDTAFRTPGSQSYGGYGDGSSSGGGAVGSTLDTSRQAAEQTRENLRMLLDRYGLDERGNAVGSRRQAAF